MMRRFLTLFVLLVTLPGLAPTWVMPDCGDEATACCPCDPSEMKLVCCCSGESTGESPAPAPANRGESQRDWSAAPAATVALVAVDRDAARLVTVDPGTDIAHVDIPLFLRHSAFLI
jgi:hypothetical protein